jgi:hypothetical protein
MRIIYGSYEFLVMLFGFCNALSTFTTLMNFFLSWKGKWLCDHLHRWHHGEFQVCREACDAFGCCKSSRRTNYTPIGWKMSLQVCRWNFWVNEILNQYLCNYIIGDHKDWGDLLGLVEFCYYSTKHLAIKMSPLNWLGYWSKTTHGFNHS